MSRTVPSFAEEGLKRFLHGMDRRLRDVERRGDWDFDTEVDPDSVSAQLRNAAQLLVMSCAGGSIASGGAYVPFDAIQAQFAFADVTVAGSSWTHTVGGVYSLTYSHEWDTYTGGGSIYVEVDGSLIPEGVLAHGTSGTGGTKTITYSAEAGSVGRIWIVQDSGTAQTCNATVHIAISDPDAEAAASPLEEFWVDSKNAGTTSLATLDSGVTYRITVTGNYRQIDTVYAYGSPDNIIHPSPGEPDEQGGIDAETVYASPTSGTYPIHYAAFEMDTGSGFAHVEPVGGAVSTPTSGHSYIYEVVGTGATMSARINDSSFTDNNGMFRVEIQRLS